MANRKTSWRKRRWNIFLNTYQSNAKFRDALNEIEKSIRIVELDNDGFSLDYDTDNEILPKFGVPGECMDAVVLYLVDPDLPEKEYLQRIRPPFFFWSTAKQYLGPKAYYGDEEPVKFLHGLINKHVMADTKEKQISGDIIEVIGGPSTVIQFFPFLLRTEIHELLDEFMDELEPLLNQHDDPGDYYASSKLLKKIQPSKANNLIEKHKLIMDLTASGSSVKNIAWELREAGFGDISETNISTIRNRLRKNKDTSQ